MVDRRRGLVMAAGLVAAVVTATGSVRADHGDEWTAAFTALVEAANPLADERLGLPDGLELPPESEVVTARFDETVDASTSSVQLWTPAAPDDVITLYRTALVADGFVETVDTPPRQGDRTQSIEFDRHDTTITVGVNDVATRLDGPEAWDSPDHGTLLGFTIERPRPVGEPSRDGPVVADLPGAVVTGTQADLGAFDDQTEISFGASFELAGPADDAIDLVVDALGGEEVEPEFGQQRRWVGMVDGHPTSVTLSSTSAAENASFTTRTCAAIEPWGTDSRATADWIVRLPCAPTIGLEPIDGEPSPATGADSSVAPASSAGPASEATARHELDEIVAAAEAVIGPTDDLAASLSDFVELPDGLVAPNNTSITRLQLFARFDSASVWGTITVHTEADAVDVAAALDANMLAAGYTRVNASASAGVITAMFTSEPDVVDQMIPISYEIVADESAGATVTYSMFGGSARPGPLLSASWLPSVDAAAGGAPSWASVEVDGAATYVSRSVRAEDPDAVVERLLADPPAGLTAEEGLARSRIHLRDGTRDIAVAADDGEIGISVAVERG